MAQVLDDMTRTDVLTYVESEHALRLQAERNILAAAHHWAVLHHPDRFAALDRKADVAHHGTALVALAIAGLRVAEVCTPFVCLPARQLLHVSE